MVRTTRVRQHSRKNAANVREHERVIRNDPREELAQPHFGAVDEAILLERSMDKSYIDVPRDNIKLPEAGEVLAYADTPGGPGSNLQGVVLAKWRDDEYVVWRYGKDGSVYWGHYFNPRAYQGDSRAAMRAAIDDYCTVVDAMREDHARGPFGA